MSRAFAAFDIDGTLIRWQLYHAIADSLVKLGFVEAGVYETVRTARMDWKRRAKGASFKSYESELIRAYEEALVGLTTKQFEQAAKVAFDEYKDQVYTYTRTLIKDLKDRGYLLFAISGSQLEIVELVARHYGFDDFVGTVYARSGSRFSGAKTIGSHHKDATLLNLVKKHKASFKDSMAVGDSLSDVAMLELVEQPIAFNPDKDLFMHAKAKGWEVVLERKNMIYELESKDGRYQLVKAG